VRGEGQDPILQAVSQLDRTSFVPMYYQLQEVMKEHIESGAWPPGGLLPSEPELARAFGVSRAVVRQALAILEDDHQVRRVQGRGTFVAHPKMIHRAGGLARLLESPRRPDVSIQVLDKRVAGGGKRIRADLDSGEREPLLRLTTLLSLAGVPLGITYSFFRRDEVPWLDAEAQVGRNLPPSLVLSEHGVTLANARVSIEASQCGQFEADRFKIPHRSAVFLVLSTEFRHLEPQPRPFEVARVEYRGDLMQFQLDLSPSTEASLSLTWELSRDALEPLVSTRRQELDDADKRVLNPAGRSGGDQIED
jgi:GntR family transcriptional regulator